MTPATPRHRDNPPLQAAKKHSSNDGSGSGAFLDSGMDYDAFETVQ